MYGKLAESRVGLNVHIDAARDNSGNMRLFEVTGMGACLLTDRKQNLSELFEEGKEIVVFDNAADAEAKLKALLADPGRCARIAAASSAHFFFVSASLRAFSCSPNSMFFRAASSAAATFAAAAARCSE